MPVIGDHWINKAFFSFIFYCMDIQEEIRKSTRGRNSCTSTSGSPFRASDVAVSRVTDWPAVLPATLMLNQWDQDRPIYNETVSLFRFQPELCWFYRGRCMEYNVSDSLWRAFPTGEGGEEHETMQKGSWEPIVENLPWGAGRNVPECAKSYYREIWDSKIPI